MMFAFLVLMQATNPSASEWDVYEACVTRHAIVYAKLDESAETIVTAAVASCEDERREARASILNKAPVSGELRTRFFELVDTLDEKVHRAGVKAVLDQRLKR